MSPIDISIFIIYMLIMLGVGYYFMRTNAGKEDYYVGGRNMGSWHIGLSVVATDVGGGFSVGLGGLGFMMGDVRLLDALHSDFWERGWQQFSLFLS